MKASAWLIMLVLGLCGCSRRVIDYDDIAQVTAEEQRHGWTLLETLGHVPPKGDYTMFMSRDLSGEQVVSISTDWIDNGVKHAKEYSAQEYDYLTYIYLIKKNNDAFTLVFRKPKPKP